MFWVAVYSMKEYVCHAGGIRRDDVAETAGSGQDVLMPPQRRTWKRCASHVYIAHFIEYQLHIERYRHMQTSALV